MASYQDIEVRLCVLEDKCEFVMKSFQIANPLDPFSPPKSLLDIYREVQAGKPLYESVNGVPDGEVLTEPVEVTPVSSTEVVEVEAASAAQTGTQTEF